MNFWESTQLALTSLRANKLRSLLTLLGVIIGIASVIAIMTIGSSLKAQTMEGLESFGAGDVQVTVTERTARDDETSDDSAGSDSGEWVEPIRAADHPEELITEEMLGRISQQLGPSLVGYSVSSGSIPKAEVLYDGFTGTLADATTSASVQGINENFLSFNSTDLAAGRGISAEDVTQSRPVAVISEKAVQAMFQGDASAALGKDIRVRDATSEATVTVIGVAKSQVGSGLVGFNDGEARVYLPYPALNAMVDGPEGFANVSFRPADKDSLQDMRQRLVDFFTAAYADSTVATAKVSDFSQGIEEINTVISSISLAVSAIAAISLLVGGIGVMNIMLVSVTERTREIGIRKALGATNAAIKTQFITEAMVVCLLGGILGILLGGGLGFAASSAFGAPGLPPLWAVLVASLFSLGIGLFFGYYPAAKAAKLHPIDALRYE
ncbi:ABC transporter permease [Corynebacterium pilosum]|uniref:ABC transporter inner membrane protein n=1 Tax=Corynebacterium pilosum TaxID=35756 RepID=A0A376CK84_9CORY|nr:ABC transporter permease [Corynebacterium pilosum]STC68844.1 ABC transporter inner membrane protein [Corynebacterium pilosum]